MQVCHECQTAGLCSEGCPPAHVHPAGGIPISLGLEGLEAALLLSHCSGIRAEQAIACLHSQA